MVQKAREALDLGIIELHIVGGLHPSLPFNYYTEMLRSLRALIRSQNIVSGYWNKPEATADTFVDGWLHSGDAARIDDEGLVYLVDRVKDMINRGGENVYCVEVENALAGAPGVYEAAVLGVPDEMMGEKVGAVVVPMPGATLDVPAVLGYLGEHIADFKVPQYVAVSGTPLPRNPGGKLLKRRLREDVDWAAAFRR